jgi:hypothetical protein
MFLMKTYRNILASLCILLSTLPSKGGALEAMESQEMILCVEVGNTRIKASILPNYDLTLEDLRKLNTIHFPSKPWLKQNIDQLFNKSSQTPLCELLNTNSLAISLSIFGPIYDKRTHGCGIRNGLFENLHECLQQQVSCPIQIESDAVSWAIGALRYLQLQGRIVHFPCIAITFGTYIGVAIAENPYKISAIEIWAMSPAYTKLQPFAQVYNLQECPVAVLLKKHIDTISGGELGTEEKMKTYRSEFNLHVQAFVNDISEHMQKVFPSLPKIQSVLIGGGYSRFIDLLDNNSVTNFILSPQVLSAQGIDSDIIQLLGCQRLFREEDILTQTYPSLNEVQAAFEN